MKTKVKYFLFTIILVFLSIHMFQQITNMVFVKSLKGYVTLVEKPVFDFEFWFDKSYQERTDIYLNQEFGFRNWYVKCHNQIYFSLFNKAMAKGVVVGKENYIYEKEYIEAYYGADLMREDYVFEKTYKLKKLTDTLKAMNKNVLVIMAPGKASFYPEYIPESFERKSEITNCMVFEKYFKKFGIPYINFNRYFIEIKDNSKYPLFPKAGIHWSYYAEYLAFDSVIHFINKNFNYNAPEISFGKFSFSKAKKRDCDLEDGMNLMFGFSDEILAYPEIIIDQQKKTKPNVIVISDSFYWGIFGDGNSGKIFNKNEFWFYYREFLSQNGKRTRGEIKLKKELKEADLIILMASEHTIKDIGNDFIDEAFNIYFPIQSIPEDINLLFIKNQIYRDPKWYFKMIKTAFEKRKPLDKVIDENAVRALEQQIKKQSQNKEEKINQIIIQMNSNPEWKAQLQKKAEERKITLDEMMKIDAIWLIEQEEN